MSSAYFKSCKSYIKFRHVPELIYVVHRGINPPQKHPPPYFLLSPLQIVHAPPFQAIPHILFFCDPPPLKIGEPPFFIFNPILSFKSI